MKDDMEYEVEVRTVVEVGPRVVCFDHEILVVQNSEPVYDVCAEIGVDVLGQVLPLALTVPRPVREVADDFVVPCVGIINTRLDITLVVGQATH